MAAPGKEYPLSMLVTCGSNNTYNHISIFKLRISSRRRHFLCHRLKGWKAQSHWASCWLEFGLHGHREAAAQAPQSIWTVKHFRECIRGMQGWEGRGKDCKPGAGGRKSTCGTIWGTQLLSIPSWLRSESSGSGCGCSGLGIRR